MASGFMGAVSGDGRVVGGTLTKLVETEYGPMDQERAALWTRSGGWKKIANETWPGCDIFQTSVFDVNRDGSAAVGSCVRRLFACLRIQVDAEDRNTKARQDQRQTGAGQCRLG